MINSMVRVFKVWAVLIGIATTLHSIAILCSVVAMPIKTAQTLNTLTMELIILPPLAKLQNIFMKLPPLLNHG